MCVCGSAHAANMFNMQQKYLNVRSAARVIFACFLDANITKISFDCNRIE